MKINGIIKYRSVWMAIAILWVILFHATVTIDNTALSFIKEIGYGGVDIFFFASGLGCFYSLSKNSNINEFLKREVNNTQVKKKGKGGIMKFEPSDTEMKNIIEKKYLQINPKFKIYVNDLVTAKYTSKKRLKDIPNFESQIVFENQREEIKK